MVKRQALADAGLSAQDSGLSLGILPRLLGYHLRRTQMAVFAHFAATVGAEEDITPGLFGMLQVIAANAGLSQSRLAEVMGVERSTIVKVIGKLERCGLVERINAAEDGRRYCLHPTARGWAAVRRMEAAILKHEQQFVAPLTADEQRILIQLLSRLHQQAGAPVKAGASLYENREEGI